MSCVASTPAADVTIPLVGLPQRQRQVLSLLCEGLTIKQIAGRLGLHPRTVGLHIRGLKERFGAENMGSDISQSSEMKNTPGKP